MNTKWVFLLGLLAVTSSQAQSAYSAAGTIKNMTVGIDMARIELSSNTGNAALFTSCSSDRQWYYLDLASITPGTKEMFATLLAAKASGQPIFVQALGCVGSYSKIVHVYACSNAPTCS